MARIRTIKPEFSQSETIGKLSREARLLFILLWTIVDDEGRARAASRMLASLLYPYDEDAPGLIEGWLSELDRNGCIVRYVVDGSTYLQVTNWLKHQKIDRPTKSKLPVASEGSRLTREDASTDLGPRTMDLGKGPGPKETRASALADGWPTNFKDQFWEKYPNKVGKPKALAKLELCMRRGVQWTAIMTGLDAYIRTKPADRAWLNPETFLNQERWSDQPALPGTAIRSDDPNSAWRESP